MIGLLDFIGSFRRTYGPAWEQRPAVDGMAAWEEFQQRATELKERARAKHGAVRHIEAAQQSLVHSALGLTANSSIPTAPVAGGCSRRVAS